MSVHDLNADLLSLVDAAVRACGWRIRPKPRHVDPIRGLPDREYEEPDGTHRVIVLRAAQGRARENVLRDRLAAALLEAPVLAESARRGDRARRRWESIALVGAPRLTERMCERLSLYAASFAPGAAWGAVDLRGIRRLEGEGLAPVAERGRRSAVRPPPMETSRRPSPFTDLGQWLLKVLLGDRLPPGWIRLPGPVDLDEPNRVSRLALRADVSPGTVSRFAAALEASGFAEVHSREIVPVRLRSLCEAWFHVVSAQPIVERRARILLGGGGDVHEKLVRLLELHTGRVDGAGRLVDVALGTFAAARELGVDFVSGAPVHLVSRDLSDTFLRRIGLAPVEGKGAFDLLVRCPPFQESVFRAAVEAPSGARITDALQTWLDVRSHPARGQELAEELWSRMGLEEDD